MYAPVLQAYKLLSLCTIHKSDHDSQELCVTAAKITNN